MHKQQRIAKCDTISYERNPLESQFNCHIDAGTLEQTCRGGELAFSKTQVIQGSYEES
jgi:hypothetical protein